MGLTESVVDPFAILVPKEKIRLEATAQWKRDVPETTALLESGSSDHKGSAESEGSELLEKGKHLCLESGRRIEMQNKSSLGLFKGEPGHFISRVPSSGFASGRRDARNTRAPSRLEAEGAAAPSSSRWACHIQAGSRPIKVIDLGTKFWPWMSHFK